MLEVARVFTEGADKKKLAEAEPPASFRHQSVRFDQCVTYAFSPLVRADSSSGDRISLCRPMSAK
jgi:hypothetical protein